MAKLILSSRLLPSGSGATLGVLILGWFSNNSGCICGVFSKKTVWVGGDSWAIAGADSAIQHAI